MAALGSYRIAITDPAECFDCGLVGVRQGVQVLFGGGDAAVAEAVLDRLQVGAAREEPGSVRVTQVVSAHGKRQPGLLESAGGQAFCWNQSREM